MARAKFYLDTRPTKDGRRHIKIIVSHNGTIALIPTGQFVRPEQWFDGDVEIDPHIKKTCAGAKVMNEIITARLEAVQGCINEIVLDGSLGGFTTATQLKNIIVAHIDGKPDKRGAVAAHFDAFISRRNAAGTVSVYRETIKKLAKYSNIDTLRFEDITVAWLKDFEVKLRKDGLAVNSVARHLRDIRAVYNDAIDYNVASLADYPFRRFKIKHERTRKRSLSVEQLRQLRDYPCTESQRQYRDIFMLIIYLGGIAIGDLFRLKEIIDGRIDYQRGKTGVWVNLKVQPEALEIIERYRGKDHLLAAADLCTNHKNFTSRMNDALKSIGAPLAVKSDPTKPGPAPVDLGNGVFPELTTYWARHTSASLMAELDVPKETIAKVLGHMDNSVTGIYIRFDYRKSDEAVRRMIDYVNEK